MATVEYEEIENTLFDDVVPDTPKKGKTRIVSSTHKTMGHLSNYIYVERVIKAEQEELLLDSGLFFISGMSRLVIHKDAMVCVEMLLGWRDVRWLEGDFEPTDTGRDIFIPRRSRY